MTKGSRTYEGLAVPLKGEATIEQETAATDMLSLKGAASQSGDFLVCMDSDESENFVVDKNGAIALSKVKIQAKTADYTVKASESGSVFTTLGATAAVTFTLPAAAEGLNYHFFNAADVDLTIDANASEVIMGFNDLGSTAITFVTSSEKIGAGVWVVSDGTNWYAFVNLGQDSQTVTLTT